MTIEDAKLIFTMGTLKFQDSEVIFDGKNQYNLVRDQVPSSGSYEFVRLSGQVYLLTTPPILEGKKDLLIEIYLYKLPVTITREL